MRIAVSATGKSADWIASNLRARDDEEGGWVPTVATKLVTAGKGAWRFHELRMGQNSVWKVPTGDYVTVDKDGKDDVPRRF